MIRGQVAQDGSPPLTARRENGTHHDPDIAETYGNRWVVRDTNGRFVDVDKYRNDLATRHPNITFIE